MEVNLQVPLLVAERKSKVMAYLWVDKLAEKELLFQVTKIPLEAPTKGRNGNISKST